MIPIYCVSQARGQVYSLDDALTVNDFADINGNGGTTPTIMLLSTILPMKRTLGYYDFRKFRQRVEAPSALTIQVIPWRDESPTSPGFTRTFPVDAVDVTSTSLWATGSAFQIQLFFSGFTRSFEVGNASCSFVPRRHSRGTGVGTNPALPVGGNLLYNGIATFNGHDLFNSILVP